MTAQTGFIDRLENFNFPVISGVMPEVATALSELIVKSNIRRLSKGLRNLVIDYYMLMGNDRPYWFLVLLEDLMPLFIFAVVEIKGVTGSAAEKHAAKLEKWVSTYYEENEVKPKGILVVNTYRDQPLIDRPEVSFPHQMLKFCSQREHCLLTSTQLLSLYLDVKKNPLRKKR